MEPPGMAARQRLFDGAIGARWRLDRHTPDGYFDSSHYGGDMVAMTRGLDTFGVDQLPFNSIGRISS